MRFPALLLAVASLCAQDDPFPGLLRQLGDDSIEIREHAALELVKLGEPALERLEKARSDTGDDEVRSRLDDVIGDIRRDLRRREFEGGNEIKGLRARISVTRAKDGTGFAASMEIMNVSSQRAYLVPIEAW